MVKLFSAGRVSLSLFARLVALRSESLANRRVFLSLANRRYQFFLQIKKDILQGRLPVTTDLAAELAALALQCKSTLSATFARHHSKRNGGKVNDYRQASLVARLIGRPCPFQR